MLEVTAKDLKEMKGGILAAQSKARKKTANPWKRKGESQSSQVGYRCGPAGEMNSEQGAASDGEP